MKLESRENEWPSESIKASACQGGGLKACEFPFKMLKGLLSNKVWEGDDWTGILPYIDREATWSRHESPLQTDGQLCYMPLFGLSLYPCVYFVYRCTPVSTSFLYYVIE